MTKRWDEEEQLVRDGRTIRDALRSVYGDREERRSAPAFPDEITDPAEVLRYLADIEIVHVEGR